MFYANICRLSCSEIQIPLLYTNGHGQHNPHRRPRLLFLRIRIIAVGEVLKCSEKLFYGILCRYQQSETLNSLFWRNSQRNVLGNLTQAGCADPESCRMAAAQRRARVSGGRTSRIELKLYAAIHSTFLFQNPPSNFKSGKAFRRKCDAYLSVQALARPPLPLHPPLYSHGCT